MEREVPEMGLIRKKREDGRRMGGCVYGRWKEKISFRFKTE